MESHLGVNAPGPVKKGRPGAKSGGRKSRMAMTAPGPCKNAEKRPGRMKTEKEPRQNENRKKDPAKRKQKKPAP